MLENHILILKITLFFIECASFLEIHLLFLFIDHVKIHLNHVQSHIVLIFN